MFHITINLASARLTTALDGEGESGCQQYSTFICSHCPPRRSPPLPAAPRRLPPLPPCAFVMPGAKVFLLR